MLQGDFSFNSQIIAQIFILNFTIPKNYYIMFWKNYPFVPLYNKISDKSKLFKEK